MRKQRYFKQAFTLPTVLITSLLMLTLLLSALQLVTASANALRTQYYNQLAREAAESGLAYAKACLSKSNDVAQWSNDTIDKTLTPSTDCMGEIISGASAYVMENAVLQTSFTVGKPYRFAGVQRIPVDGKVELKRTSDGEVYRSYSYALSSQTGASTLVNSVSFGYTTGSYCPRAGSFFATIDEYGATRGTGLNACGQLGNGGTGDSAIPVSFGLPSSKRAAQVFTNFLSLGTNLFVLTTNGEVWGAGANEYGQLGDGNGASTNKTTPVQFRLPTSDNVATFVAPLGWTTFVVTSQGNVYAAGRNLDGVAGIGDTPYGKDANVIIPQKVPLPAGEKARADAQSWAVDRLNAYVITESGKVYGWGANEYGQLARNNTSKNRTPIQLTLPGGSSVLAEQVAYDGSTVYIRANNGKVFSAGRTTFGQTGNRFARLRSRGNDECLAANGAVLTTAVCDETNDNQLWRFDESGMMRVQQNTGSRYCLDNKNWANTEIGINNVCSGNSAQTYAPLYTCYSVGNCEPYAMRIVSTFTGQYCLHANLRGDLQVGLSGCSASFSQQFIPYDAMLREVALPAGKKAIDISTDQWFATAIMDDGTAYTWGFNNGAFGNGAVPEDQSNRDGHIQWNPTPVRYGTLGNTGQPKAISSWTTSNGWPAARSNIFVVTDDGKVFGTGGNVEGQLGIGSTSSTSIATPQQMNLMGVDSTFASLVRSGRGTTVIYTSNGKVYTVGDNSNGQLGDGTTTSSSTPRANNYTNIKPGTSLRY